MTSELAQIASTLRNAGRAEATGGCAGFFAVPDGTGKVIVTADLGYDHEGHFDSPGCKAAQARMVDGYRQTLEAAGWVVKVSGDGTGLVATRRPARTVAALTRSQAGSLADKLSAAALDADPDTAGVLLDAVADLINLRNGHPVPWLARP